MKTLRLTALLSTLALLAACEKLTAENYSSLQMGMDYDYIVDTIGAPAECKENLGAKLCEWQSGDKKVTIHFLANKAVLFDKSGF